jgi:ATP-dependent DNA helicase DinG
MTTSAAPGEPASGRFSDSARGIMRRAIAEAGGMEVFFAGTLSSENLVERVRVCARGNGGAVPAISEGLKAREVVIHNHPSGDTTPSDADLQLASFFGFQGHGVFITDNAVERVYVVIEPFVDKARCRLDPGEASALLGNDGPIAKKLRGYEERPQQTAMMRAVIRAFNDETISVIEAPTGVGKTFAYLLPSVLWALANRERVVVSTKTINLQEQIVERDIPLLKRCLGKEFSVVLMKGRSNYLCWRRLERAVSEATLFADLEEEKALRAIAEWADKTTDGTLSDLPFVPPGDVWQQVCSDSDTCRMGSCPQAGRCFFGKARRAVAKADIVVVNHHMLFSDLAIKRESGTFAAMAVLPVYHRLILDEAHSVEDSATEYFGMEATRIGALALFGRFLRTERGKERGLLPYLRTQLVRLHSPHLRDRVDAALGVIDNNLLPALSSAREAVNAAFQTIRAWTADRCGQIGRDIKWRLTAQELTDPELRALHTELVVPAADELSVCVRWCVQLLRLLRELDLPHPEGEEPPLATEMLQLDAFRGRLERLGRNLVEGTNERLEPNTVRWVEIDARNEGIVRVVRCPLEVGPAMAEWVYPNLKTVVMTSATLAVRNQFDFMYQRIGLDRITDRPVDDHVLPTPFVFEKQAMLGIATDMPDPSDRAFLDACIDTIRQALLITRGHAFILFTSFYALDYTHKRLDEELRQARITPLRQGQAARTRLLERFRSDAASVLFATDSFWEGVDVAGEALQCVIVPKLPFRVPTEPVLEARAEAIQASGGNSFMDFAVPQAVIKFRQGFGRLIRRRSDWGSVLVLDRRVVTKHYGRVFLESLPAMHKVTGTSAEVMRSLHDFHTTRRGEDAVSAGKQDRA